jgi:hypothetical protein
LLFVPLTVKILLDKIILLSFSLNEREKAVASLLFCLEDIRITRWVGYKSGGGAVLLAAKAENLTQVGNRLASLFFNSTIH